jgi:hypothetical protein
MVDQVSSNFHPKCANIGPTILDGIGIEWWSLKSLWSRFKALKPFGFS